MSTGCFNTALSSLLEYDKRLWRPKKNIHFAPKRDNLILGALRPIFSLLLQVQTIHFSAGTLSLT